jgi:multidrug efflux pump subunit AcrB
MKYMPTTVDVVLLISIFVALVFLPVVLTSMNFSKKENKIKEKGDEKGLFKKLE